MSNLLALGRTGLQVSPVCFGCWQLSPRFWGDQPEEQMIAAMRRAPEVGVNFYDTADAYGEGLSEEVLGKALADLPRQELIVATKVYWHFHPDLRRYPDLSGPYIIQACENSLRRLQMQYIDLYQVHAWDPLTDLAESIGALETLVQQGKIRAYGCSNWNAQQMAAGHALGGNFASCQPPYSLLKREAENEILPYCRGNDVGVLVYSPLQNGLLTGKYQGHETFTDFRKDNPFFQGEKFRSLCQKVAQVGEIGKAYGLTTVQTVLAVTRMNKAVHSTIVGIKRPADIEEAAAGMGKTLSREDAFKVRDLLKV